MIEENQLILKIASHLLLYPDETLLSSLKSLARVIAQLPQSRPRQVFGEFLQRFNDRNLIAWQEEYSRLFDLTPATCLNLTYHKYGDGRDRGFALAELQQLYRQAGYEKTAAELPDFLPLVLEFLAVCRPADAFWLQAAYRPQIEALSERLQEAGTIYAGLLSVVLGTWQAL